jgi:DNA modification methylase
MIRILDGDCREVLKTLPDESVHCVVTSPPYFGLRDYGVDGQIGLELTSAEFIAEIVGVFREVRRVLRGDGTAWVNMGDSYAGSWGAQSREHAGKHAPNVSAISANQVKAAQKRTNTGTIREPGLKPKDLMGIPWRLALALQEDGWWLRQDIIWAKPNPMPESVQDRCTKAHEYVFMLTKSSKYFYDADAIKEPGSENSHGGTPNEGGRKQEAIGQQKGGTLGVPAMRSDKQRGHSRRHAGFNDRWDAMERAEQCSGLRNKRSVWTVGTQPFSEAHFATFPPALIEPCILAGCPEGGTVLDPFGGAGTTGLVADRLKRDAILIELNPEYAAMARRRIYNDAPLFAEVQ